MPLPLALAPYGDSPPAWISLVATVGVARTVWLYRRSERPMAPALLLEIAGTALFALALYVWALIEVF